MPGVRPDGHGRTNPCGVDDQRRTRRRRPSSIVGVWQSSSCSGVPRTRAAWANEGADRFSLSVICGVTVAIQRPSRRTETRYQSMSAFHRTRFVSSRVFVIAGQIVIGGSGSGAGGSGSGAGSGAGGSGSGAGGSGSVPWRIAALPVSMLLTRLLSCPSSSPRSVNVSSRTPTRA